MLDRLVGYEVSNVAFRRIGPGTSAGRVQSVATRLVVDRERARMAFRSGSLLGPRRHVRTRDAATPAFPATLVDARRQAPRVGPRLRRRHRRARRRRRRRAPRRRRARSRSPTRLDDQPFTVASVESRAYTERPKAPFITSTLQQEAGRKLGFSAGAHHARRAGSLRARPHHLHAHRLHVARRIRRSSAARGQIRRCTATTTCPTSRATYRSKVKNAQEAHEAIRPAGDRMRTADDLSRELQGTDERRLYDLIWKRTVASPDGRRAHPPGHAPARGDVDRGRGGGVPGDRSHHRVPRLPPRLRRRRRRPRRRARGPRGDPPAARRGRRGRRASELRPVGSHHAAAGALHRSEPGEGARGARHRSAVDVRDRDRHDRRTSATTCGRRAPRSCPRGPRSPRCSCSSATSRTSSTTSSPRRWRRRSTRSRAARAKPRSGCTPSTSGTAQVGLRELVAEEHLAQIDKAEVNTVHIGPTPRAASSSCASGPTARNIERGDEQGADPRRPRARRAHARDGRGAARRGRRRPTRARHRSRRPASPCSRSPAASVRSCSSASRPTGRRRSRSARRCSRRWTRRRSRSSEALALLVAPARRRRRRRRRGDHRAERALRARTSRRAPTAAASASEDQLFTVTLAEAEAIFAQPKQRRGRVAKPPLAELGAHPESGAPVRVLDGRFGPYVTDGTDERVGAARHRSRVGHARAGGRAARASAPRAAPATKKAHGEEVDRRRRRTAKKSTAKKTTAKKATAKKAHARRRRPAKATRRPKPPTPTRHGT